MAFDAVVSPLERARGQGLVRRRLDAQGFVVRFADGLRLKLKGSEYRRIHALISRRTPLAMGEGLNASDVSISRAAVDCSISHTVTEISEPLGSKSPRLWRNSVTGSPRRPTISRGSRFPGQRLTILFHTPSLKPVLHLRTSAMTSPRG
jgi:hypothetical protein